MQKNPKLKTMRKKFVVILALCLLCCGLLNANPVDTEEARRKAVQFLTEKRAGDGRRMAPARTPRMKLAHRRTTTGGQPAFYIFNNEGGGFVIVGGDDQAEGILGFSDLGQFDATDIPDGLADLLHGYEQQISHVSGQSKRRAVKRADSQWADIAPLILTQWNQRAPYNDLCPIDPETGDRSLTGCVATAVAQLLYYHQWPEIGYGYVSTDRNEEVYSADLTKVRFEWDMMKTGYGTNDQDENQAVAKLMYHCALLSNSLFSSDGTDGYIYSSDLRSKLGYKEPKWMEMDGTNRQQFEAAIYDDLKNSRPVLFSAYDPDSDGHEMIIDGYRSDGFFHINLGWGGDEDGYYKLTAIDTEYYNFTTDQLIFYGIEPDYSAPTEADVYPRESYQLSEDGTELLKWTGDESYIHLGADAALWGVTEIGDEAFADCTSLEAVFVSSQIDHISKNAFTDCINLQSIEADESSEYYHTTDGLLIDKYNMVRASTAKNSLVIPETVSDLYSQAFSNCTDLKQITMLGKNPIYPYNDCFNSDMDFSSVTLYVPLQSLSQYRNHPFWGQFTNIVGISEPVSKKLTVETTTGQKKDYMLYQMPVMKNNGTTLELITGLGQTVNYELEKLKKMTFVDTPQLGNPNGKGGVDIADVTALVSHLKGNTPAGFDRLAADINQDGRVDGDDVGALAAFMIGRREALARQDGQTAGLGTEPAGESPDDAAMYIYLNDGSRLKAFLMRQVAHISYSCTGLDGLTYDMPVVQLVQTRDSLYRIPIAAIDSICYQTPEPIMKKGLFIIDGTNVGNIASVDFDNYTITFKSTTPAAQLPNQGQVIYSDLVEDPLPMGFSGRVTKVSSGNVYTWVSAGPEEVYDRLLVVGRIEPGGSSYSSARGIRRAPTPHHYEPTYDINVGLDDYLKIQGKGTMVIDYVFDINAFNSEPALVDASLKHIVDLELISEITIDKVSGGVLQQDGQRVKEKFPISVPFFSFGPFSANISAGVYFSYGGNFKIGIRGLKYTSTTIRTFHWSSDDPLHPKWEKGKDGDGWGTPLDDLKVTLTLDGKVSLGLCGKVNLQVWKPNWMELALTAKAGPELKGSFSLDTDLFKSDGFGTALYKEFSENVKLSLGTKLGLDLSFKFKKYDPLTLAGVSTTIPAFTVTLLPKLSKPALPQIFRLGHNSFYFETAYNWDHIEPMNVKTKASNISLFPGPIGLTITDASGNDISSHYAEGFDNWHWFKTSTFQTSVNNLSPQTVKVYPRYKLLGLIPMKGEPAEITIPKPMTLAAATATVGEDRSVQVDINDGWGYYSVESSDDGIAIPTYRRRADGTHCVNIMGYKAGPATITVKDVRSGRTQTVDVSVTPTPIQLSATNIKMRVGDTKVLTASPRANYTIESSNDNVVTAFVDLSNSGSNRMLSLFRIKAVGKGPATLTITDPVRCRTATIEVDVKGPDELLDTPEGIDLGLPSGLLWSPWNIGASAPEEAGDYYAWGELKPKDVYSWSTYEHCDGTQETAYDLGESIGFTQHDVVNKEWGGMWRMPTDDNFRELINNCTSEWMELNGQWGREFTGPSGKSIFLPAAGYRMGSECNNESVTGYYWSETYSSYSWGTKYYLACYTQFDNSGVNRYGGQRYLGYSIRPVMKSNTDNYVEGICTIQYPEPGAVVGSHGTNIGYSITMPWNGTFISIVTISDKPDMSHKVTGVRYSINGTYGSTQGCNNSIGNLQPNTRYYWQISYFDFETESERKCSPVFSFTTNQE